MWDSASSCSGVSPSSPSGHLGLTVSGNVWIFSDPNLEIPLAEDQASAQSHLSHLTTPTLLKSTGTALELHEIRLLLPCSRECFHLLGFPYICFYLFSPETWRHERCLSTSPTVRERGISKRFGGNETPSLQRMKHL
jgi:hypothetical protein